MRYDKIIKRKSKISNKLDDLTMENDRLKRNNEELFSILNGMMHEVRRFSGELSDYAEKINKLTTNKDEPINGQIKELSNTIFFTSGMLASRLGFTDIELNREVITRQVKIRTGIYKKFDKARHILMNRATLKRIRINFKGNSVSEFDAIEAFELVPFVILDNAVKYSPENQEITVIFNEQRQGLDVLISSCGPIVDSNELPNIFNKGFRGRNGALAVSAGDGIGLYLAKTLCDLTSIDISAECKQDAKFQMNGVDYSTFEVRLTKRS